jgi:hypothetical protein
MGTPLVHYLTGGRDRRDDGLLRCRPSTLDRRKGVKREQSRRDKLWATAVGGALSATVCTPPYLLGRLGILMLASSTLAILIAGIFVLALGVSLQAGATGAVRAIKMSAKLTVTRHPTGAPASKS